MGGQQVKNNTVANRITNVFDHTIIFKQHGFKIANYDLHIELYDNILTINNDLISFSWQGKTCQLLYLGLPINISYERVFGKIRTTNINNTTTLYYDNKEIVSGGNVVKLLSNVDISDSNKLVVYNNTNNICLL